MKRKGVVFAACMAAVVVFTSCEKDAGENDNELNSNDRTFMLQASVSNTAEVGAGQLALTKASNAAVKAYAQTMIAEHSVAQTDLKALGTTVGFAVKDTIDPMHVQMITQLNALSGRAFDSAYIHSQVADHQLTLTFFQTELDNGQHAQVEGYAATYQPRIQMHHTRADSIARAYFRR